MSDPETTRSPKHEEARNSLPEELRSAFDELVADYRFYATTIYRQPFVSYSILAELVRTGWRFTKPDDSAKQGD